MHEIQNIHDLRHRLREQRGPQPRIAFVPTMGNLHEGHMALVSKASELGDMTVVSIFINPFQFGANEDYGSYPRTLEQDRARLTAAGVDLLFVPQVEEIYPEGTQLITHIEVPGLGQLLCGEQRPALFRGVTTVVGILFHLVQPQVALFGEKDYQQLLLIRRMVRDLAMPVEIVAVPTVRAPDGLAMSSRNAYLTPEERRQAPLLYQVLQETRQALVEGEKNYPALEERGKQVLKATGFRPEYFSIRRSQDLGIPQAEDRELRIFAAAWLGQARLIDNIPL
jgi:pantoate--beta-alanine ligase